MQALDQRSDTKPEQMIDLPEPTPENIRAVLNAAGWSQVTAARRLGISRQSIKRYCAARDAVRASEMPLPTWNLLLLMTAQHPHYILVPRTALLAPDSQVLK